MKKVFQTIIDRGNGNCMQAAIASLFELPLEKVPHFISLGKDWWQTYCDFLQEQGYAFEDYLYNYLYESMAQTQSDCFVAPMKAKWSISKKKLYKEHSVNGYFHASVLSPGNFSLKDADRGCHHSVIIDKDYNIVHDPNPKYQTVRQYPLAHLIKFNGVICVDLYKKI